MKKGIKIPMKDLPKLREQIAADTVGLYDYKVKEWNKKLGEKLDKVIENFKPNELLTTDD
jgi:hypothetical protein